MMEPGIYRHYKGKLYHVLGIALHSETEDEFVVYRTLYGSCNLWVRPLTMFQEKVTVGGTAIPRFSPVHLDPSLPTTPLKGV